MKFLIKSALLLAAIGICRCASTAQVREGVYRIENAADNLHITTEGANTAFARVVGENFQNFGEQRWRVEKIGTNLYNLMPEKHSTNNALSFYKDVAKKHALPERWNFLPVAEGAFQIQNQRTALCLVSSGRRREIVEGKCDKYLPDRQWRFHPL